MAVCAAEGLRPFFLGGTERVVHQAAGHIGKKYPSISFAGVRNGYFTSGEEQEVVATIRNSGADCLFLGMPSPRKERFLAVHSDSLGIPFVMGVGGSFDVVAGKTRRAPQALQTCGLEWLYRVYQEPRRMWWRYTKTNAVFALLLLKEMMRTRLKHPVRELAPSK
jgi:N-acetylglucosaminyldiphosphoundecaprenol N-acetyl-beta-D-mannosaminyltransferase